VRTAGDRRRRWENKVVRAANEGIRSEDTTTGAVDHPRRLADHTLSAALAVRSPRMPRVDLR